MKNPQYEEVVTYGQFKNWIIQQICTFILYKIRRLYIYDLPKKSLGAWMQEFVEWCEYDEIIRDEKVVQNK